MLLTRPDLFHGTLSPEQIEIEGLRPHPNALRLRMLSDDGALADHQGHFVFATSSSLEAALYAFRIKPSDQASAATMLVATITHAGIERGL